MVQKSWKASAGSARFAQGVEVKLLHFLSGPGGSSQKLQIEGDVVQGIVGLFAGHDVIFDCGFIGE
jgi:hypothetical protein